MVKNKSEATTMAKHISCDCKSKLGIRSEKIDGFIRIYDGTRYFVLFGPEKNDDICNRIRYFICLKSSITYFFFSLLRENQS